MQIESPQLTYLKNTSMNDPLEQFHQLSCITDDCFDVAISNKSFIENGGSCLCAGDIWGLVYVFECGLDIDFLEALGDIVHLDLESVLMEILASLIHKISNNLIAEVLFVAFFLLLVIIILNLKRIKKVLFPFLPLFKDVVEDKELYDEAYQVLLGNTRDSDILLKAKPKKKTVQGNFFYSVQNLIFRLVKAILQDNTALQRKEYFAITHFLFLVIFSFNLIGLVPFSYTVTSNIIITLFFASVHFCSINLLGFYKKGIKIVDLFVPSGLPLILVPFLIIIELISYLSKVVSLSVRLFANMMSGHALLKILIGFSGALLSTLSASNIILAIIPGITVTLILFLEALIAFLQAYVFIILLTIYLNDVMHSH